MKSLLVTCLLMLGVSAMLLHPSVTGTSIKFGSTGNSLKVEQNTVPAVVYCYSQTSLGGSCMKLNSSVSHLCTCNFNNMIKSVEMTGFWIFYEHSNYNKYGGKIYYGFGRDIAFDLPSEHSNVISSIRLIESKMNVNKNLIYFFEGPSCTSHWHKWKTHVESFSDLMVKFASILILGKSPWTLYSEENFKGQHVCIYPNIKYSPQHGRTSLSYVYHYDANQIGSSSIYHVGIYSNMTTLGAANFKIKSFKLGCFSKSKADGGNIYLDGSLERGGWGAIN